MIEAARLVRVRELQTALTKAAAENLRLKTENEMLFAHFDLAVLAANDLAALPPDGRPLEELALSTYVRSRGSMAGRGVLRAAGVSANPYAVRSYPQYAGPGRNPSSYSCRIRVR